jgi:TIR domain
VKKPKRCDSVTPASVFICYKRSAHPDQELATKLFEKLKAKGHHPFMDKVMSVGLPWQEELEERIKKSDFFVTFLSSAALKSPMIKTEIETAGEASHEFGTPHIIQVRIDFDEKLPFQLRFLNWSQYAEWNSQHDTDRVIEEVMDCVQSGQAAGGKRPPPPSTVPPKGDAGDAKIETWLEPQKPKGLPIVSPTIASRAAQAVRTVLAPYAPSVEPLEEGAFLILYLEELHGNVFEITRSDGQATESPDRILSNIRAEIVRQTDYLNRLYTESEIEGLFNDLRNVIDAWGKRCQEMDQMDQQTSAEIAGLEQAMARATQEAAKLESKLQQFSTAFLSSSAYSAKMEQVRQICESRKANAHRAFLSQHDAAWLRARNIARELSARRRWPQIDRAFDGSPEQRFEMSTWRNTDPERYREAMGRLAGQQPLHPFVLSRHCTETVSALPSDRGSLAPLLAEAAASVLLVPVSSVYDDRRGEMLFLAAHFLANAVTQLQTGQLSGTTNVAMAEQALPVLETLEANYPLWPDPNELTVQNRLLLLGAANRIQQAFDYGIRHKDRIWKVGGGCYNLACFGSLLGQHELAWKYLEHAFRDLGYEHVKHALTDPDLEPLRRAKAREWDAFFALSVRAWIEHGVISDDIVFSNLSSYPLTNIRLTCYTHYVNGICNQLEVTTPRIDADTRQKWSDVVSVPGKQLTSSVLRCYLVCDQSEGWVNQAVKAVGES